MRVGALFAGIGGFEHGLELAGHEVAWRVELDKAARGVLERHWPGVPLFNDVREVGAGTLEPVDLVCGGFPCQDLSVAGRRAGLGGERSGLWWEFHRILSELRPRWCFVENVPGLLSSNGGRDMGAILWSLGKLGYGYAYRVLDARFFGLAQRRRRVLIVGCLGDGRRAAQVLLEPEGLRGDLAARSEAREDVAGTLGASAARNRGLGNENETAFITGRGWWSESERAATVAACHELNRTVVADSCHTLHAEPLLIAGTLTGESHASGDGMQRGCPIVSAYQQHGSDVGEARMGVRRLTPTECTRLQGFPDDWLEVHHGDAEEADARALLHILWRAAGAEAREGWRPRIALALLAPEVLLAGVSAGWISWAMAAECATSAGQVQGPLSWPEGFLCALRIVGASGPSPHRREPFEQLSEQLGRSLQGLPFEGASAATALVQRSGLRQTVPAEWLVRSAFAASEARKAGAVSDAARYRQLGNAFPPPMAAWVGRRIMEHLA